MPLNERENHSGKLNVASDRFARRTVLVARGSASFDFLCKGAQIAKYPHKLQIQSSKTASLQFAFQ